MSDKTLQYQVTVFYNGLFIVLKLLLVLFLICRLQPIAPALTTASFLFYLTIFTAVCKAVHCAPHNCHVVDDEKAYWCEASQMCHQLSPSVTHNRR